MTDTHIKIKPVTPRVQYTGNGSTTTFPYSFAIFDETDMVVYVDDDIIESGYTVIGAGETDGGTVVFDTAPASGKKITLLRNVPIERITDFQEGGTFRPKNINDELDRQTAFVQQVQEKIDRAVIVGPTSSVDPEEVLTQVQRVYGSIDNVDKVADDIENVNLDATYIAEINTVSTAVDEIRNISNYTSDIRTVSYNISNVNAVAGNATNINAVNANKANINAVAGNATNINAVNANKTNIDTVAGDKTNIDTVAGNITKVNAVAGNTTNINAVAGNATNINAVNANKTNIDTCATNIAAIQDAPNQAQAAADSAALAKQYADDKINQNHISNCITEIPQDIKLELNNGKLTLKAGSKVYVPNGSGTFNAVTIAQDISRSAFGTDTGNNRYIFPVYSNGVITGMSWGSLTNVSSGITPPTSGTFYNTSTNYINNYSGGSVVDQRGFPIGMITLSSGTPTSIDQVFNGFGFIGSTIFALPGVKGLIPNGRNDDGTLKNIEVSVPSVKLLTLQPSITLNGNGRFLLNSTWITSRLGSYDEVNNYVLATNGDKLSSVVIAENCTVTAGVINKFNSKTAFHAVDYNDISDMQSAYLSNIAQGNYKTITNLFSGPTSSAQNITLSQDYTNFDALLVCGAAGDNYISRNSTNIITIDELNRRIANSSVISGSTGSWTLYASATDYWCCASTSTTTSLVVLGANCKIVAIYGIRF